MTNGTLRVKLHRYRLRPLGRAMEIVLDEDAREISYLVDSGGDETDWVRRYAFRYETKDWIRRQQIESFLTRRLVTYMKRT